MKKALLLLLTVYGLALRLYGLDVVAVWLDEAISVLAAQMVAAQGVPLLPSGWLYISGMPQSYLLAGWSYVLQLFTLFGVEFSVWAPYFVRLPSVIVGTILIPVCYHVAAKVWNDRVGLLLALFMAVNQFQIAWSRQARMYIFLELFFILALYYWWKLLAAHGYQSAAHGKRNAAHGITIRKDLVLALLFSLLAVLSHPAGLLLVVPVVGLFVIYRRDVFNEMSDVQYYLSVLVFGVFFWYGLRQVVGLRVSNYFLQHVGWISEAYLPIAVVALLCVLATWKERFVLGIPVVLLLYGSFFISIFAYRYTFFVIPLIAVCAFAYLEEALEWKWMVYVIGVLLIAGSSALWVPQEEIYLEPDTPQPPWNEVYEYVVGNKFVLTIDEDGNTFEQRAVVDAHPVIARYYGVEVDGWLNNSLTGRHHNLTADAYLGVPIMAPTGLVVVDERAWQSVDRSLLENTSFVSFGEEYWRSARVYVVE